MADPATMSIVGATAFKTLGDFAANKHAQGTLKVQEKAARTRAFQVSAAHMQDLNMTLDTIRAIRASSGVGADSATGIAVQRKNADIANRNRVVASGNERAQAEQLKQDRAFQKRLGYLQLGANIFGGMSRLATA